MLNSQKKSIDELLRDDSAITRGLAEGVRRALLIHKKLGHSIVIWKDGKIVTVPPEEIEVDENPPQ
ncbi:MAG TPA: hypothetical protein VIL86_12145 [Tepidisphaeraceae bacterium]